MTIFPKTSFRSPGCVTPSWWFCYITLWKGWHAACHVSTLCMLEADFPPPFPSLLTRVSSTPLPLSTSAKGWPCYGQRFGPALHRPQNREHPIVVHSLCCTSVCLFDSLGVWAFVKADHVCAGEHRPGEQCFSIFVLVPRKFCHAMRAGGGGFSRVTWGQGCG